MGPMAIHRLRKSLLADSRPHPLKPVASFLQRGEPEEDILYNSKNWPVDTKSIEISQPIARRRLQILRIEVRIVRSLQFLQGKCSQR